MVEPALSHVVDQRVTKELDNAGGKNVEQCEQQALLVWGGDGRCLGFGRGFAAHEPGERADRGADWSVRCRCRRPILWAGPVLLRVWAVLSPPLLPRLRLVVVSG